MYLPFSTHDGQVTLLAEAHANYVSMEMLVRLTLVWAYAHIHPQDSSADMSGKSQVAPP